MALGFVTLAIVEAIMLLSSTGNLDNVILPSVNIELPHIVLLIMLTLFGLGLLKGKLNYKLDSIYNNSSSRVFF